MSQLTYLLCLAFILIAFRQDIKESRQISNALWIPFIWLAVGASKAFTYWIYPHRIFLITTQYARATGNDLASGSSLDRNFYIFLICLGVVVLYRRRDRFSFDRANNIWLLMLYIYGLMSVSWSDYAGVAVRRWIKVAGDVVMILVILSEENHDEAIDHILRRCAIVLVPLSIYYIRYDRLIGVYYDRTGGRISWRGVSDNKNGLGMFCAILSVFLIWRLIKAWPRISRLDAFLLLLTLYLLRGAQSATSYVVFIIGVIILAFATYLNGDSKKLKKALIASIIFTLVLQGLFIVILNKSGDALLFSVTGRDSSFTGRVPLWQEMIKIGSQRPFLGVGYGNFWASDSVQALWAREAFVWRPTNSHNGYIDTFIDLGVLGLIILFLWIIQSYNNIMNSFEKNERGISILRLVFFFMVLFYNLTESSLFMGTSFLWGLFLFSGIAVVHKAGTPGKPGPEVSMEIPS